MSDETLIVPFKELTIDDQLGFVEEPFEIMDREIKTLKRSKDHGSRRVTWEWEDQMKRMYPQ